VMGEREIANSMLHVLEEEIAQNPIVRECPI